MASDTHYREVFFSTAEIIRPNNTSVYAAKDVISTATATTDIGYITFPGVARHEGDGGVVVDLHIFTDDPTFTGSMSIWLYNYPPIQQPVDNAPYKILYAENGLRAGGPITTDPSETQGSGSTASQAHLSIAEHVAPTFRCAPDSRDIYGILTTDGVFNPKANQKFYIKLIIEQD